jgi:hypothetical protein
MVEFIIEIDEEYIAITEILRLELEILMELLAMTTIEFTLFPKKFHVLYV